MRVTAVAPEWGQPSDQAGVGLALLAGPAFLGGMTKLVHKADSIYEDVPDERYDFPRAYLKAVGEGVGDWVVYYEPVKAGPRGYFAVAKIARVVPKPREEGRFLALMEPGSYLEFDSDVPRLQSGRPWEAALADAAGYPKAGGAVQLAVRRLPEAEFAAIVRAGLPVDLERIEARRYESVSPQADEGAAPFERPVIERLVSRPTATWRSGGRYGRRMTTAVRCRVCGCATGAGGQR